MDLKGACNYETIPIALFYWKFALKGPPQSICHTTQLSCHVVFPQRPKSTKSECHSKGCSPLHYTCTVTLQSHDIYRLQQTIVKANNIFSMHILNPPSPSTHHQQALHFQQGPHRSNDQRSTPTTAASHPIELTSTLPPVSPAHLSRSLPSSVYPEAFNGRNVIFRKRIRIPPTALVQTALNQNANCRLWFRTERVRSRLVPCLVGVSYCIVMHFMVVRWWLIGVSGLRKCYMEPFVAEAEAAWLRLELWPWISCTKLGLSALLISGRGNNLHA